MALELTSAAFQDGDTIPTKYTADGGNASPPLRWRAAPDGTRSLALVCEDPDAPRGTFTHWVLFNIPAQTEELNEGLPHETSLLAGAEQATNDFGKIGYGGPSPPPGKPHRYVFKLYALDRRLDVKPGATKAAVLDAIKGHVLGEGQLLGNYGRAGKTS